MGLFDVLVMPHARRRGLARKVTESLYAWAWSHGARFAYLQVVATNDAAMPLYAAQGFRTVYDYEYCVRRRLDPPAASLNSRSREEHTKWRTILGKRATRPA